MEKKKIKKLQLSKETLCELDDRKMKYPAGGLTGTRACTECGLNCATGVYC